MSLSTKGASFLPLRGFSSRFTHQISSPDKGPSEPSHAPCGQCGAEDEDDFSYFCVFMDLHMPVMGGEKAARAIRDLEAELRTRASPEDPCIFPLPVPIIALSADSQSSITNCAAFNDFLEKPYNRQQLLEKVQQRMPPVGICPSCPRLSVVPESKDS
jgi:CheY-like chemotaxis protein